MLNYIWPWNPCWICSCHKNHKIVKFRTITWSFLHKVNSLYHTDAQREQFTCFPLWFFVKLSRPVATILVLQSAPNSLKLLRAIIWSFIHKLESICQSFFVKVVYTFFFLYGSMLNCIWPWKPSWIYSRHQNHKIYQEPSFDHSCIYWIHFVIWFLNQRL